MRGTSASLPKRGEAPPPELRQVVGYERATAYHLDAMKTVLIAANYLLLVSWLVVAVLLLANGTLNSATFLLVMVVGAAVGRSFTHLIDRAALNAPLWTNSRSRSTGVAAAPLASESAPNCPTFAPPDPGPDNFVATA